MLLWWYIIATNYDAPWIIVFFSYSLFFTRNFAFDFCLHKKFINFLLFVGGMRFTKIFLILQSQWWHKWNTLASRLFHFSANPFWLLQIICCLWIQLTLLLIGLPLWYRLLSSSPSLFSISVFRILLFLFISLHFYGLGISFQLYFLLFLTSIFSVHLFVSLSTLSLPL